MINWYGGLDAQTEEELKKEIIEIECEIADKYGEYVLNKQRFNNIYDLKKPISELRELTEYLERIYDYLQSVHGGHAEL